MAAIKEFNTHDVTRKEQILELALDVASAEGLEGLTIGRLSKRAGMSKSGLFAHFGSKKELQRSTVDFAQKQFRENVWDRVSDVRPGIARLHFMLRTWVDHVENWGLSGGCFFSAASAEFDDRPGEIQTRLVELIHQWVAYLEQEISVAQEMGHIVGNIESGQLTFELHASVQEANLYRQLFRREDAFDLARNSIEGRLGAVATNKGKKILGS
jgi:AcrR family transcriptional regulator